jgi:hypothetical protein
MKKQIILLCTLFMSMHQLIAQTTPSQKMDEQRGWLTQFYISDIGIAKKSWIKRTVLPGNHHY